MFKYRFKPDEKQQEQIAEFFKRETKYFVFLLHGCRMLRHKVFVLCRSIK